MDHKDTTNEKRRPRHLSPEDLAALDEQRSAEQLRLLEEQRSLEEQRLQETRQMRETLDLLVSALAQSGISLPTAPAPESRSLPAQRSDEEQRAFEERRLQEEQRLKEQRRRYEEQRRALEEQRRAREEERLLAEQRLQEEKERLFEQQRLLEEQRKLDEEQDIREQLALEEQRQQEEQRLRAEVRTRQYAAAKQEIEARQAADLPVMTEEERRKAVEARRQAALRKEIDARLETALQQEREERAARASGELEPKREVSVPAENARVVKPEKKSEKGKHVKKKVARTASNTKLFYDKLLPAAEDSHVRNQRRLKSGVVWLFVLPILLLIIRKLTDSSKIAFLIIWIIGMFIIAAFLVFIAYTDYELQQQLSELQSVIPGSEEASLGTLLPTREEVAAALPLRTESLREILAQRQEREEPNAEYSSDHQG